MTRAFSSCIVGGLVLVACARGVVDEASTELASTPAPKLDASVPVPTPASPEGHDDQVVVDAGSDATADSGGDASIDAGQDSGPGLPVVTPPIVDGTITAGEYGVHVDGQNQQASVVGNPASTTWYMTWTNADLYVGISAANLAEGVVLYVDAAATGNVNGTTVGYAYDGTRPSLPIHADFVVYVKAGYEETRATDSANGWTAPVVNALTVSTAGTTREFRIPWTQIRAAGRPAAFAWLGYATSSSGYVYGQLPAMNAGGSIGLSTPYGSFYGITDSTPGTGTKPFALVQP